MADEWPTVASDYQIIEQIGQGAFAKVWKAYCAPKKTHVAIKIMDLEKITTSFEDIRAEVQTMKMTNHPNVLKCYCRDIKAGNILLDGEGHVVIADFGVSGWMMEGGDRRKNRQTFVGTPCWMAPEVMEQVKGYDYKADIWSLGITALELAKGYAPYARYQPMKVLLLTLQEDPPSLKSYDDDGSSQQFSRHYKDMIKVCLQKDPTKRPATSAMLKHSFFKKAGDAAFLASNLLNKIEDIGETSMTAGIADALPGTGPLYATGTKLPPGLEDSEDAKYVPGTTWVFDDEEEGKEDMSMDDFASQFNMVTGGEEFRSQ
ncbi:hypothetical protein P43SY_001063 [Pythium insidiosum]|uniref:Protein kinase domain-containing protein n=1 Tax=Pythium insidiosum TaxID=114742 RepID=A0AAD5QB11_PYTIN|nr:hypothetical protein P43SY_001063 [Pythium insidiosum]KAJ0410695.1 hypothetical protein ATCC90586_008280 [Pythium insidiosum]